ncbi:MAG: hypothetical protein ACE5KV_02600 [Thermoplasmata archaeon]
MIPVDKVGRNGSSSYSIAVARTRFDVGITDFASPFKPLHIYTADSLSELESVVGVAYFARRLWKFHAKQMPAGVYDVWIAQGEAYQISIDSSGPVRVEFVGT